MNSGNELAIQEPLVIETKDQSEEEVCLRSKRPVVRIHSGAPNLEVPPQSFQQNPEDAPTQDPPLNVCSEPQSSKFWQCSGNGDKQSASPVTTLGKGDWRSKPRKLRKPYPVVVDGLPCFAIPLSQGKVAIVDSDDIEKVAGRNWCLHRKTHLEYASSGSGAKHTYLHRLITGAPISLVVDHLNKNGLDCRKNNMELCSQGTNARRGFQRKGSIVYQPEISLPC